MRRNTYFVRLHLICEDCEFWSNVLQTCECNLKVVPCLHTKLPADNILEAYHIARVFLSHHPNSKFTILKITRRV